MLNKKLTLFALIAALVGSNFAVTTATPTTSHTSIPKAAGVCAGIWLTTNTVWIYVRFIKYCKKNQLQPTFENFKQYAKTLNNKAMSKDKKEFPYLFAGLTAIELAAVAYLGKSIYNGYKTTKVPSLVVPVDPRTPVAPRGLVAPAVPLAPEAAEPLSTAEQRRLSQLDDPKRNFGNLPIFYLDMREWSSRLGLSNDEIASFRAIIKAKIAPPAPLTTTTLTSGATQNQRPPALSINDAPPYNPNESEREHRRQALDFLRKLPTTQTQHRKK